jgi:hypothetical protein
VLLELSMSMTRVIMPLPSDLHLLRVPHAWSFSLLGHLVLLPFWKGDDEKCPSTAAANSFSRSGIGSTNVLRKNDVQQIVELPGVGEHLMGLLKFIQSDGLHQQNSQIIMAYSHITTRPTTETL